jgi:hypothetical protein
MQHLLHELMLEEETAGGDRVEQKNPTINLRNHESILQKDLEDLIPHNNLTSSGKYLDIQQCSIISSRISSSIIISSGRLGVILHKNGGSDILLGLLKMGRQTSTRKTAHLLYLLSFLDCLFRFVQQVPQKITRHPERENLVEVTKININEEGTAPLLEGNNGKVNIMKVVALTTIILKDIVVTVIEVMKKLAQPRMYLDLLPETSIAQLGAFLPALLSFNPPLWQDHLLVMGDNLETTQGLQTDGWVHPSLHVPTEAVHLELMDPAQMLDNSIC